MVNYWGGDIGSSKETKDFSTHIPENDSNIRLDSNSSAEVSGDSEKRRESLRLARESILTGSYLHIIDEVDVSRCDYLELAEGIYEVVYNETVVGYANSKISKQELTLGSN